MSDDASTYDDFCMAQYEFLKCGTAFISGWIAILCLCKRINYRQQQGDTEDIIWNTVRDFDISDCPFSGSLYSLFLCYAFGADIHFRI